VRSMLSTQDTARPDDELLPVALVFPGQGAQHPRMAAGLYRHCEVFTHAMNEAFSLLGERGRRIRAHWLAVEPPPDYDDVTIAQPLLYAVDHALGLTVLSWGVRPVALLGHSVGELAAATLAGVIDFADGMRLMRDRIDLFADTPPGGMLAVAASVDEVRDQLRGGVYLAAVNATRQLLLAGERAPLDRTADTLRERGMVCVDVLARQAFHSPLVGGAVAASRPGWHDTKLAAPKIDLYSAYAPDVLTAETACDPDFWAAQPERPVQFAPALDRLLADHRCLLVEAGPGTSLTLLARRHPAVTRGGSRVVSLLPDRHHGDVADRVSIANAQEVLRHHGAPCHP
jgi:acyl transferase domain-containing protein